MCEKDFGGCACGGNELFRVQCKLCGGCFCEGCGNGNCGEGHHYPGGSEVEYSTIQAAIDAAVDGETINIGCGTYAEQLTIRDKKLNLVGETTADGEPGVTITPATLTGEQSGNVTYSIVRVATSADSESVAEASLKNIIIQGNIEDVGTNYTAYGMSDTENKQYVGLLADLANVRMDNCKIIDITFGETLRNSQNGFGIVAYGASRSVTVTLNNTEISSFNKAALLTSANIEMEGCTISGFGTDTKCAQNGIQCNSSANLTARNTVIKNIAYGGTGNWLANAILNYGEGDILLEGVTCENVDAVYYTEAGTTVIRDCSFEDADNVKFIMRCYGGKTTITGETKVNGTWHICAYNDSYITIEDGTFTGGSIWNQSAGMSVTGGNFEWFEDENDYAGTLTISGGVFVGEPAESYIASGYKAVPIEDDTYNYEVKRIISGLTGSGFDTPVEYQTLTDPVMAIEEGENSTPDSFQASTQWYKVVEGKEDELVTAGTAAEGRAVYKSVTVLTANAGYTFEDVDDAQGLLGWDGGKAVASADGSTLTITKTYEPVAVIPCGCVIEEDAVEFSLEDIALGMEDSKEVELSASAVVNTDNCQIPNHQPEVTYEYVTSSAGASISGNKLVVTQPGEVVVTVKVKVDAMEEPVEKTVTVTVTTERATQEEIDAFNAAISQLKEQHPEEKYTEESYRNFKEMIQAAEDKAKEVPVAKSELDAAQQAAQEAAAGLVTKLEELGNAYEVLELPKQEDEEKYTSETWKVLTDARASFMEEYEKGEAADVEKLQALLAELKTASEALETTEAAALKAALADLEKELAEAKLIVDAGQKDYTDATWTAFEAAYEAAVKGAASSTMTAAQLESLLGQLRSARAALAEKMPETPGTPGTPDIPATPDKSGTAVNATLAAPSIRSINAKEYKTGMRVNISVKPVAGADHYAVYRIARGKTTLLGVTASGVNTIKDFAPVTRTASYYAVAISADGKIKSENGAAVKFTLSAKTKIKKAVSTADGIRLTWKKAKKVTKYVIYRSTKKNSGYTRIRVLKKNNLSYVDKTAKKGKTYYYKIVVMYSGKASLMSKAVKGVRK